MATATAKKPTTTKAPAKPTAAKATAPTEPTEAATPTTAPQPAPVPTTLVEALTSGGAQLFKKRANGTMRSLPYLAPGTTDRKQAEHVNERREAGKTVGDIAAELNVSVATVRRFVTNLQNAHDVEADKHNDKWTPDTKQVIIHTVTAK